MARPNAAYLAAGSGCYTDDIQLPRLVHVVFLRNPLPHARFSAIDTAAAAAMEGVIRIFTGADIAKLCRPMRAELRNLPQHKPIAQMPVAIDEVAWQGEPVAAVVAHSRAAAEDAAERIEIDWEELPAIADPGAALEHGAPLVHSALASNLAFVTRIENGDCDGAFAAAVKTVARDFDFGRLAGVPLEPRTIIADYNPADRSLTVYQSHQSPHLMQEIFATHLGLPQHKVRVIARDVGGAFGIKLHAYGDEMAVAAIAMILGRPVKFVCNRLEAFQSDAQARECRVSGRMAIDGDGRILAIDAELLLGIGAYSIYPRTGLGDGIQAASFLGAPYNLAALRASLRVAYQNKVPAGAFRGVGQPLATVVTEQLVDDAAAAIGLDPLELRRRNYLRLDQLPGTSRGGLRLGALSLGACLDKLASLMDYPRLRQEQRELRARGIHRGIGIATFIEQTAIGATLYSAAGLPITTQDCCSLRMEPSGVVRCAVGCTDQGQGTLTGIAQIVAGVLGVPIEDVAVSAGDSAGPQGGGAWASRGLSIGGEAAYAAASDLRRNILEIAAAVLQSSAERLDLRDRSIVDAADGAPRLTLKELCALAYYRQDLLPPGGARELAVTRQYTPRTDPYFVANGVQASYLEVDVDSGWIRLLGHWVVEDCGRVINPLLVDEQIRGGVVQGLGAALFEHCIYDSEGQLLTGSLADYLVPMAAEMPDIVVAHVTTPQSGTALGIKGVGEAGTVGASAAVWCAVNDALRPLGARVSRQPFTPQIVLEALGRVSGTGS
ncbi:MAG TPA: xanthine dehydrogenase family protein molybdopterin-binding subunit [Stellaceae bacterium]|nr:xanthine dehydrogenase family protein molybdopterin-binding subunit [Stellaceae bacterium]